MATTSKSPLFLKVHIAEHALDQVSETPVLAATHCSVTLPQGHSIL